MTKTLVWCAVLSGLSSVHALAMEEPKNSQDEMCTLVLESRQSRRFSPEAIDALLVEQRNKYCPGFDSRRIDEEKRLALFLERGQIVNRLSDMTDLPIVVRPSREMARIRTDVVLLNLYKQFIDTLSSPVVRPLLPRDLGVSITDCDLTKNNLYTLPLYLLVAELPNLENLIARDNKITYIETIDPHDDSSFLEKNRALKRVDVSYNRLEDSESINMLLTRCDQLHYLNLRNNRFTSSAQSLVHAYALGRFCWPFDGPNKVLEEISEKGIKVCTFKNDDRTLEIEFSLATT